MATPSLAGTKAGCCPLRPTTNVMTVTTMAAATTTGAERLIEWTSFHGQPGASLTDARYVTCPNRGCGCRARFGGARSARALAPPQALPGGALHACRGDGPAWRGPRAAASHCLAARGWRGARRPDARPGGGADRGASEGPRRGLGALSARGALAHGRRNLWRRGGHGVRRVRDRAVLAGSNQLGGCIARRALAAGPARAVFARYLDRDRVRHDLE